jgi:hypothetical protein
LNWTSAKNRSNTDHSNTPSAHHQSSHGSKVLKGLGALE